MRLEEYASMLLAKDALKGNNSAEALEFSLVLDRFNKEYGIIEHTAYGLPKSETPENSFWEENPDIKEYARDENNKAFEKAEHLDLFPEKDWLLESKLASFFGNENLKKVTEEISLLQNTPQESRTQGQREKKQAFDSILKKMKISLSENLLQIEKDAATNFPFYLIMMYFEEPTLNGEKLNDLLSPNKNDREVLKLEQGTSTREKIMRMSGKMNNAAIDIFYPLDGENQTIKTTDTMYYDSSVNRIIFGGKRDLNTQGPIISEVYNEINKNLTPDKISTLLKKSYSPAEFKKKFAESIQEIVKGFLSASGEQEKYRLTRMAEKNQTKETLISTLFPGKEQDKDSFETSINQNPQLKKFLTLCSATFENSTSAELQKFRSGLLKLNTLLQNRDELEKIADPIIKNALIKLHNFIIEKKSDSSDFPAALTVFFNLFTRQDLNSPAIDPTDPNFKLNINDFSALINHLSSPVPLDQNGQLSLFSQDFRNKYEAQKSAQPDHSTADIEADLELAYG